MVKGPTLPTFDWEGNGRYLTLCLLVLLGLPENFKPLFGKQPHENTTPDTKIKVYKRIAEKLLPEEYAINPTVCGNRVKSKVEAMHTKYKFHVKRIQATGEGVRTPEGDVYLECYVGAEGPDENTTHHVRTMWDDILKDFPFFAHFHSFCYSRANSVPPIVTTGVGPSGRTTVHYQQPSSWVPTTQPTQESQDEFIDPELRDQSAGSDPQLSAVNGFHFHPAGPLPPPWQGPNDPTSPPATPRPATIVPTFPFTPGAVSTPTSHFGPIASSAPPATPIVNYYHQTLTENMPVSTPNITPAPAAPKKGPKPSTFAIEKSVERAKQTIKRVPVKRGIEEVLADVTRETAAAMNARANRQLLIDEREQLIKLHELGVYNRKQLLRKMKELEDGAAGSSKAPPAKKQRAASPEWDCESSDNLPSSDGPSLDDNIPSDNFNPT